MAKKNNNKSFDLRGASNFETALNTLNALTGITSTAIWTSASLVTNGTEIVLDKTVPNSVGKAIHKTATSDGFSSVWDSVMSEKSTKAATDELYTLKNKFVGGSKSSTKHLDKALKSLNKDDRKAARKEITAACAIVKSLTEAKISAMIKKHGLKDAIIKVGKLVAKA